MSLTRPMLSLFGDKNSQPNEGVGFICIFYSAMTSPLDIWEKQERGGEIRRFLDSDRTASLELMSYVHPFSTYITAPRIPYITLGIQLPYCVIILKNLYRNIVLAIQIKDLSGTKRRFQLSNTYKTSRIKAQVAFVPLQLPSTSDWKQLEINLALLTLRAYGIGYKETVRVQIHANCSLRMIYFSLIPREIDKAVEILSGILENIKGDVKIRNAEEVSQRTYILVPSTFPSHVPSFEQYSTEVETSFEKLATSGKRKKHGLKSKSDEKTVSEINSLPSGREDEEKEIIQNDRDENAIQENSIIPYSWLETNLEHQVDPYWMNPGTNTAVLIQTIDNQIHQVEKHMAMKLELDFTDFFHGSPPAEFTQNSKLDNNDTQTKGNDESVDDDRKINSNS